MTEDLSIKGSLAETTVSSLFRSLIRNRETALLELSAEEGTNEIFFREGRLVFAQTTDRDLRLGEVLLRSGALDIQQFQTAMDLERPGKRIGAVLCELGFISPEQLVRGVELQVKGILADVFAWPRGSYELNFREDHPRDIVALQLDTDRIVLDATHAVPRWSQVYRGLSSLETVVQRTPGQDNRLYKLELTEEEAHIYEAVELRYPIAELCRLSYLPDFEVCRIVWGLLTVNLFEEATGEPAEAVADTHEVEFRLEELVQNYNDSFVSIFSIIESKIGAGVYDFVDSVFADLPDDLRRHYFFNLDLRDRGRVDFEQLYHNLLQANEANLEATVHNLMNELLYNWILRVRQVFGTDLEAEVTRALNAIRD